MASAWRACASARGPVAARAVRFGGAFERVEHALLPGRAFELEPLVPIRCSRAGRNLPERARATARRRGRGRRRAAPGLVSSAKRGDVGPHARCAGRAATPARRRPRTIGALGQATPQPRQRGAQAVATFLLVAVFPQQRDEPRARHGLVGSRRQVEQQRAALLRGEVDLGRRGACLDLGRPEQAQSQGVNVFNNSPPRRMVLAKFNP